MERKQVEVPEAGDEEGAHDVATHSVRIPDDLAARLDAIAEATKRTKSSFIIEALERFLQEREDLEIALARLRDPGAEWVEHDTVRDELGLD